jgi:hypothetical protein
MKLDKIFPSINYHFHIYSRKVNIHSTNSWNCLMDSLLVSRPTPTIILIHSWHIEITVDCSMGPKILSIADRHSFRMVNIWWTTFVTSVWVLSCCNYLTWWVGALSKSRSISRNLFMWLSSHRFFLRSERTNARKISTLYYTFVDNARRL